MSGAGCSSSFPGTRLDFFKLQHWLVQSFELSNHDCRHATPFISEASSFPNNIPATFRVCGTKSCGIRFSRPLQAFGSECMSVFDSCGFDFQTPTGLWLPASGSSTVSKQSSLLWNFRLRVAVGFRIRGLYRGVPKQSCRQVTESGRQLKFPNQWAWKFPNQSSPKFPNPGVYEYEVCTKNSIKNAPAPCGKSLEEAWHLVLKKSAGPDLPSGEAYGVLQKMDSQTTSLPLNKGTLRV